MQEAKFSGLIIASQPTQRATKVVHKVELIVYDETIKLSKTRG